MGLALQVEVLGKLAKQGLDENVVVSGAIFQGPTVRIGRPRGLDNHLTIDDPTVSRHHVTVELRDGVWVLRDEFSDSGVWNIELETRASERVREKVLVETTVLALGKVFVRFTPTLVD